MRASSMRVNSAAEGWPVQNGASTAVVRAFVAAAPGLALGAAKPLDERARDKKSMVRIPRRNTRPPGSGVMEPKRSLPWVAERAGEALGAGGRCRRRRIAAPEKGR